MSAAEKARYYQALKAAGVHFDKHYRDYKTDELKQAYTSLVSQSPMAAAAVPDEEVDFAPIAEQPVQHTPAPPVAAPDTIPGLRLNTDQEDAPIRTDENGLIWYQDEIRKPGYAAPRARRVLQYTDPGSEMRTVQNGEYLESFEVAGSHSRPSEIKVTLPSYQVGIYKDPRFPFKIHVYNDVRGFDLFQVQEFYGGGDLVPTEIKRIYVENVLCYDIRTTIRAIQAEARDLQLANMKGF